VAANLHRVRAQERLAGILLIAAAVLAIASANSPLKAGYDRLLHLELGPLDVDHWISEGLMAIFFLLVGLEVKREWLEGRLSRAADRRLPIIAAVGGMAVPALVYLFAVGTDPTQIRGWAIPAATDIAFAVGILAILGRHAPASIKLLLVTIAIVDDVGAVAIIALVYTTDLHVLMLVLAVALTGGMATLNLLGVRQLWPYLAGFAILWCLVLASGVHATVAGVVAALTIPLGRGEKRSPLKGLEHAIHPWVMFGIVPLFGFSSAGVDLAGGLAILAQPIAIGVLLGLFIGKQLGVFGAIYLAVRIGIAAPPPETHWLHIWGAALLCGVGFTMSLFIGALAFPNDPQGIEAAKFGTLAGSLLAALAGYLVLRLSSPAESRESDFDEATQLFAADAD
jgi:NhaA family Na+:H+ antiporter